MKRGFTFGCFILFLISAGNCKKAPVTGASKGIILHNCEEKTGSQSQGYKICFNKLITDCRCALGGVCAWAGYAQAEFSFVRNNDTAVFQLATLKNTLLQNDTTIDGIKITLENILPYPDYDHVLNEPIKAILKIEE